MLFVSRYRKFLAKMYSRVFKHNLSKYAIRMRSLCTWRPFFLEATNTLWIHTWTFPNRFNMPSRPAKLSKIRLRCPIFSISKSDVSSSSQIFLTLSISEYRLSWNVGMYSTSRRSVSHSFKVKLVTFLRPDWVDPKADGRRRSFSFSKVHQLWWLDNSLSIVKTHLQTPSRRTNKPN